MIGTGQMKFSRPKALLAERLYKLQERSELPGCDFHLVDPCGIVLLVAIAVKLDSGIQFRRAYIVGSKGTIDVALPGFLASARRKGMIGPEAR
jgi:hypothetical protein